MATLDNGLMRLSFDDATGLLTEFVDLANGVTHVAPPDDPLQIWQVDLRAGADQKSVVAPGSEGSFTATVAEVDGGGSEAVLRWQALMFQNEDEALDVTVRVLLRPGEAMSEWRLSVENHRDRYGVQSVSFPRFQKWPPAKAYDLSYGAYNWGKHIRALDERHEGRFSSYHWSMQFFVLEAAGAGIYVAAHDPDQHYKEFVCDPADATAMVAPVENAGVEGTGYESPYPVVVGTYAGGWFEGCKLYRQWAVNQPWLSKGPIADRDDVPAHLKDIGLWFISSYPSPTAETTPEEWTDEIIAASRYYAVPCGVHVYNWHVSNFDNEYPEFFPAKPGVAEAFARLREAGVVVMPYINARLWDMRASTYPEAMPYTEKDPQGYPYLEIYGRTSGQLVSMCPHTEFWQDRIAEICRRIVDELGADAIYLDQISAEPANLCYDASHGHPLGGGCHWHQGYRRMLAKVRAVTSAPGRPVALTSENPGDAHIDGCDAFLIWNRRQEFEVPMMAAVYSGYTLYYASPHPTENMQSFAMAQARDFIWGSQLGWMSPTMADPYRAHLRTLVQLRVHMRDFLTYGELVGELAPLDDVGTVSAVWPQGDEPATATLPAVMSSLWRARDGRLGVFIVNLSQQPREYRFRLNPRDYGLDSDQVSWTQVTTSGEAGSAQVRPADEERVVALESFGTAVYTVRAAR